MGAGGSTMAGPEASRRKATKAGSPSTRPLPQQLHLKELREPPVLGLNLFGDAVRDAMDPRLRT